MRLTMEKDCVICGELDCIHEITKVLVLDDYPDIEYLTHLLICSQCECFHAGSKEMYLNKLEMLMALNKKYHLKKT
jgi:hypothetical protein